MHTLLTHGALSPAPAKTPFHSILGQTSKFVHTNVLNTYNIHTLFLGLFWTNPWEVDVALSYILQILQILGQTSSILFITIVHT